MPDISNLKRAIAARAALYQKWREQIRALSDERNRTAGKIYDATADMEAAAIRFIDEAEREQYAATWTDRWPR